MDEVNVVTEPAKPGGGGTVNRLQIFCMALLALGAGFETVRYLIAMPSSMAGHACAALLCVFLCAALMLRLKRMRRVLAACGLFLPSFAGGYLLACALYLGAPGDVHVPAPAKPVPSSSGHTAVIYYTHGEPRTYEGAFEAWNHAIHEMDESGVPFVPWPFRPFFFSKVRNEYFEAGGSFHNLIHMRTMQRLQAAYREKHDPSARFYIAYSDDAPGPDEAAARAINDGAARITVLNVWMTESDHLEAGVAAIRALRPEQYGVELCVTDALWRSRRLMRMYVDRALAAAADTPRPDVGILLVAHGQPASWDALFEKQPAQEDAFRLATKQLLVEKGFREGSIVLAYMEFKEPGIAASVRRLIETGAKKILVAPVNISAEGIHSEHEIPSMVEGAGAPSSVEIVHLGAWNDDPLLLDELLERLESCGG